MPASAFLIEVKKKEGFPDGQAVALLESARDLGIRDVETLSVGALYNIQGKLTERVVVSLCEKLLCDPVVEEYIVRKSKAPPLLGTVNIKVTYHPGVTDATSGTVMEALEPLGIKGIEEVSSGSIYHLTLKAGVFAPEQSGEAIRMLCERLLANPVIQNYEVYDSSGKLHLKG